MIEIIVADSVYLSTPKEALKGLLWEYLSWGNGQFIERYHYSFNIIAILAQDLQTLDIYSAERGGCLMLVYLDRALVGVIGMHKISDQVAEIRRMYIRPQGRGQGIGRLMLKHLFTAAAAMGYTTLRLETARYMAEAQALYRSFGFREIAPYAESSLPQTALQHFLFMELDLAAYPSFASQFQLNEDRVMQ